MMTDTQTINAPDEGRSAPRSWRARVQQWRARTRRISHTTARAAAKPKKTLLALLREWHKRAGLFAFLFLGWLGTSGFLINQSASWGYDTTRIRAHWVTSLYGLHAEAPRQGFEAGKHWFAETSDYTLLDAKPLQARIDKPIGFVVGGTADQPLLYIATSGSVVVLTDDGQRYDELFPPILPIENVHRIGKTADGAIAVQDLDAYQSKDDGNTWTTVDPAKVTWSQPKQIPETERQQMLPYSQPSVSLEHVLVDMHSGRLFGNIGVWIINLVGFSAFWLALSGVWMWWRIRSQRNARRVSA